MLWVSKAPSQWVLLSTQNIGPMILSSHDFDFSYSHFSAIFDYLKHNPLEPVDRQKLEEECGVGVVVTPDQVEAAVSQF